MDIPEQLSLEQIQEYLDASQPFRFQANDRQGLYEWVDGTLRQYRYGGLKRGDKGLLRRYIAKITGLSRAQVTRLIGGFRESGAVHPAQYRRHRCTHRYTTTDIELLAEVDEAHQSLSGPATQKILQRACHDCHDAL